MTILVACLGEDQYSWPSVLKLAAQEWEKVFFVGPESLQSQLQLKAHMSFISVDEKTPLPDLVESIKSKIQSNVFGEVGVSLFSGSGLLHMAVLSAVLKSGGGVRLVHFSDDIIEV